MEFSKHVSVASFREIEVDIVW